MSSNDIDWMVIKIMNDSRGEKNLEICLFKNR